MLMCVEKILAGACLIIQSEARYAELAARPAARRASRLASVRGSVFGHTLMFFVALRCEIWQVLAMFAASTPAISSAGAKQ